MPLAAPLLVPPFPRLILSLCLAAATLEAFAATDVVPLKPSVTLSPATPKGKQVTGSSHVEADHLKGIDGEYFEGEGSVEVRNLRERLEADWFHYDMNTDEAHARGHVVLTQGQDRLEGSELKLKLTERIGEMKDVSYSVRGKGGSLLRGGAELLKFKGPDRYSMDDATYTTCPADQQDWVLKMGELNLDYVSSVGDARQVRVEFMNTPILYTPWLDFALDNQRKSGFLAPTYGATTERGLELIAPWYWNISPNRDATFYPRYMTRRGPQLGGEFRYLEADFGGDVNLEVLPKDQVLGRERYRGLFRHRSQFSSQLTGSLTYERVSDNAYFTDLSNLVSQTSQVNLPREAMLAYDGGWWHAMGRTQTYQTLQDPAAPLLDSEIPYRRLPQLTLTANHPGALGQASSFDFAGEFVRFTHPGATLDEGNRLHLNPSISFPISTPYSVLTPKLGWYLTRYGLSNTTGSNHSQTRSLPTFSLDSNLLMERDWSWKQQGYIQTLEPRAYYLYIPYKDQSTIPVFDSVASDLSLDQMFSENQYTGADRINNANQLTLAVTSRFLEQAGGAERLEVTLGQRFYFTDQRVTLPGETPRGGKTTDLIGEVSGQVNSRLRLSSGVQYNADTSKVVKANLGATWRDGPGRLFNTDYRYTQGSLHQIDLSAQWPLARKWYGLGRINYSFRESRLVEGVAGFEYNAGCWSLRGLLQRLATSVNGNSNAVFLQLELHGLTKLGPNPLDVLKRSITGYVPSSNFDQSDETLP
jgi:LPS-assembly protein